MRAMDQRDTDTMNKDYTHFRYEAPQDLLQRVTKEWYMTHQPAFYDIDRSRERMSPALKSTRTYHLRKPNLPKGSIVKTESAQNVIDCIDTPLYSKFRMVKELIEWVGRYHYPDTGFQTLGRVFITRLEQSSNIGRHVDEGHYFESLHRHHFILRSQSTFFCWDHERTEMRAGELWRVNNSIPHWVENDSAPRTIIIFDAA